MTVDVKELLDLYGYSASEFSKMTRIEYTRLLKLKNGKIKYSKTDIFRIKNWLNKRGKNVIQVTFKPLDTKIYSWEAKGVIIDYDTRKKAKEKEQRRVKCENIQRELQQKALEWEREHGWY